MLNTIFKDQLPLGIAQAVATIILALAVMVVASQQKIHLEKEIVVALTRGIVQVIIAGLVLTLLLKSAAWLAIPTILAMMVVASIISARRAKNIPGAFLVSLYSISFGTGLVILLMTLAGVIDTAISTMIPVSSMLIAQAMNSSAQALERFQSDVRSHVGLIEAGLALGAEPNTMVSPYVEKAVYSSLIPRIDALSSLGIVWIPGVMAGMILAGIDPIYAAVYQFSVIAMIFAASGLTSVVCSLLVRSHAFTPAAQLILRPGQEQAKAKTAVVK